MSDDIAEKLDVGEKALKQYEVSEGEYEAVRVKLMPLCIGFEPNFPDASDDFNLGVSQGMTDLERAALGKFIHDEEMLLQQTRLLSGAVKRVFYRHTFPESSGQFSDRIDPYSYLDL